MVATLVQAVAFAPTADASGTGRPGTTDPDKPVAVHKATNLESRKLQKGPRTPHKTPEATWSAAGDAVVALNDAGSKTGRAVRAKNLPLQLNKPSTKQAKNPLGGNVTTRILSHKAAQKAGVTGLLFTLQPQTAKDSGSVGASLDYGTFAQAYGGNFGSRLTLVELPACALTTPAKAKCRTTKPVATTNDTEQQTLTAESVALTSGTATVLAAVAGDTAKTGSYQASPLSPSASWSTSLNTGDFNWSYNFGIPSVPGGLAPSVGLSYSSGTIDGRTGNTNNQSSWIGDGFDLSPGFIERRYKPCADDGQKADDGVSRPGDLCWGYDNAYLTFNGKGGELVPTGKADELKLKNDDGTRVARLKSTDRANGDTDGEYWRLTLANGTRYYFGYNRLPGWADGKETTDSAWTVPVFGDDADEPCHKDTFAASYCQQAWRWNLDYAVDPHGNAIAYYYTKEDNSYGRNLTAADDSRYTRGGYLDRIEYGLKSSSIYGTKALAKVDFSSSERCLPDTHTDCSSISKDSAYWYDTPWDMNCEADADCDKGRFSPTFFTRKRLTGITTQVLNGAGYSDIDSWKLTHRWGQADVDYQLLLDSIQHTGHTGPTAAPEITEQKTTFSYTQLANRLDKTGDGYAPYIKARLSTIDDETSGQLNVNYSSPACTFATTPTPATNTTRCFPQMLGGSIDEKPTTNWFNKYVTTSITQKDRTGGSPDAVTAYEYLDDAAWHYDDDDGLTLEKNKTWSDWRGYGHVRVKTGGQGGGTALKSQADSYYLRGMDGDRQNEDGSKTKSVTVSLGTGEGTAITDDPSGTGFTYKTETYSGPDGKVLAKTVNQPWHHETAKKVRDWGTITANQTGTLNTYNWTSLDNGAGANWRKTYASYSHDGTGRVVMQHDAGDTSTATDNRCSRTTYATNTGDNILDRIARVETVAAACTDTPDRSKAVIADVRTAYDGGAYGAAPTKGDATATAVLTKHDGTTATYLETGTTYDSYGRALKTTDTSADVTAKGDSTPVRTARLDGRATTTAYTPTTGFPTSTTTTTPPAEAGDNTTAQTTTITWDPLRGQPLTSTDTNNKVTAFTYDALGRSDKVWLADRKTGQTPSYDYDYFIEDGKPATIRTLTLNNEGGQIASYTLYDGQLRPRQTQDVGPDGGRLLTDTFYDERGLTAKTFAPYYAEGAPFQEKDLVKPDDALKVETQTRTTYDGLGRAIESKQIAGNGDGGAVLGTTTTIYGGDRTTVIPPVGATATTTLTDARGKITDLRQLHSRNANAAYDTTHYTYTLANQLDTVTDPAGNTWKYGYDQRGNQTLAVDPDTGETKSTYDDRNQLVTTTDARGTVLYHAYDELGRPTETREKDVNGPLRASWAYDTIAGAKGQPASSTRYVGKDEYTSKVTQYDQLYRPTRTSVVIPEAEKALAGTYSTSTSYKTSGLVAGVSYSAAGSLPGGGYSYTYDDTLRPISILGDGIKADISKYSLTGKPLQYTYGSTAAGAKKAWATNTYELGTQRLATSRVDRQDVAGVDRLNTYKYDESGNVLAISDVSRAGTDNQCFTYDYLRRMNESWAEGDATCTGTPSASATGGVAPYWTSYTYDAVGNRKTEIQHDLTGNTAKDTTKDYKYPTPGTAQPHTLTDVTETGPSGTKKSSYTYNDTGDTKTRVINGDTQTLEWDAEGHLAKVTQPVEGKADAVTEYIYDTAGNRLISRGPDATTLYLGQGELVLPKGATKPKATRYIPLAGSQAVQADDGSVSITIADHLGTGQLAIKASDLSLSQRRTTPFGNSRGTSTGTWPGTKGFVGGTTDTDTGLTHLGAREYDPATGRFISADPVMDLTDPQQINGYAYSNNNPTTFSDPSGLYTDDGTGHSEQHPKATGPKPKNQGIPAGGTGPGNCYYTCGDRDPDPTKVGYIATNRNEVRDSQKQIYAAVAEIATPKQNEAWLDAYRQDMQKWYGKYGAEGVTADNAIGVATNVCWVHKDIGCSQELRDYFEDVELARMVAHGMYEDDAGPPVGKLAAKGSDLKRALGRGCNCFLADTEVLMANGSTKKIQDIKLGDKVLATDPRTGKTAESEVTATITTENDKHFAELTLSAADGEERLVATSEHPFWSVTEKRWVEAGKLKPGTRLRTSSGHTLEVTKVRRYEDAARTYNLTVKDQHTYYVLAGGTPVLVHNSNCGNRPHDKARGAAGVDEMTETFEKFYNKSDIYSESYGNGLDLWTPYGRRQVDIAVRNSDGNLHLYEVKVNKSNYTKGQRRKDEWLAKTYGFKTSVVRRGTACPICNP
ncbi:polymorphic toxin-type HINT domain-containing protein [Streptomyces sp. NPDC088785]|uniref:polymorphic toxin-type HINT domain-containing protein n=1 Tax=Streptomyces sp. NPDC088785 TaxID=3365897 RepID=UPI00381094A8